MIFYIEHMTLIMYSAFNTSVVLTNVYPAKKNGDGWTRTTDPGIMSSGRRFKQGLGAEVEMKPQKNETPGI